MAAKFYWFMLLLFFMIPTSQADVLFGLGYAPGQFVVEDFENKSVIKIKELSSESPAVDFLSSSSYFQVELLQVLRKRVETGLEDSQGRYEIKVVIEANRTYRVAPDNQLVEMNSGEDLLEGLSFVFQVSPDGSYEVLRSWHESNPDFDFSTIESIIDQIYGDKVFPPVKLSLGEVYSSNFPVFHSIPGVGYFALELHQDYRLKEVKEDRAYFDIDARANGLTDIPKMAMEVYGAGRGSHTYNIDNRVHEDSSLDLDVNFYLHQDGKVIHMNMVSSGKSRVEVLRGKM